MTCKEIETRMYPDRDNERMGSRNIVADMLYEVARVIGFNMDLLKKDFNKNEAFQFLETDFMEIQEVVEAAKSSKGKRLRCKDYKGASGNFIEQMMRSFLTLAEHNGAEQNALKEEWVKMCVQTECETVRYHIREKTHKFEEDIEKHYFGTPYMTENEFMDEGISGTAKLAFLHFILENIYLDISEVRGAYWFFKMKHEGKRIENICESGKYLQGLSLEQRKHYKEDIHYYMEYVRDLEEDGDLTQMIDKFIDVENAHGKLQDIEMQKRLLEMILQQRNLHAENIFKDRDNQIEMPENNKPEDNMSLSEQYDLEYNQIRQSLREYDYYWMKKLRVPMTEDNETMMEIEFRQQFGTALFPKEGDAKTWEI